MFFSELILLMAAVVMYILFYLLSSESSRLWFDPHFPCGAFFRLSHTSDCNWYSSGYSARRLALYRVSAWSGWLCVSIKRLCEIASLICNFYLSVAVLSSLVLEIVLCVAEVLSKQPTTEVRSL